MSDIKELRTESDALMNSWKERCAQIKSISSTDMNQKVLDSCKALEDIAIWLREHGYERQKYKMIEEQPMMYQNVNNLCNVWDWAEHTFYLIDVQENRTPTATASEYAQETKFQPIKEQSITEKIKDFIFGSKKSK